MSSANGQPGDLVVDVNSIKDESHRGLNSPQHGSRSINGTPTSSHSSLLADGPGQNSGPIEFISSDGIKPETMYTTHIFSSMANGHNSGSGTPSPIPYGDHVTQFNPAQTSIGYAGTTTSTTLRPGSTGGFSVSDPYYREYFTTVASGGGTPEPVYTGQIRQGQVSYGDDANAGTTASFVERYVRQSSAYHGKGVIAAATAAGLTVDLPSPDSGIGADAITPRDQNTMQQVSTTAQPPSHDTNNISSHYRASTTRNCANPTQPSSTPST